MTSFRIALTELDRLMSSALLRAALLALILVPALFGGLYLYADHDPQDGLERVPAAIVVLDEGVEGTDGGQVNAGTEVSSELVEREAFDWEVVEEEVALDGVEDGTYDFALTIPAGFSRALTTPTQADPGAGRLLITTSDATSNVSTTVSDEISEAVGEALAAQFAGEATGAVSLGLAEVRAQVRQAAKGAADVRAGLSDASADSRRLAQRADGLTDRSPQDGNADEIASEASGIRAVAGTVSREYRRVRVALIRRMAQAGLNTAQRQYVIAAYDFLGRSVNGLSASLQDTANDLVALAGGSGRAPTGSREVARDLGRLHDRLVELRQGSAELDKDLRAGAQDIPGDEQRTALVSSEPLGELDLQNVADTDAETYGEGLAPLLLALGVWIGAFALFLLVRPISVRAVSANQAPLRVALAGWVTPALLGLLQAGVLATAVLLTVEVAPEDVAPTVAFLLLTSCVFVAIMQCLNALFGAVGQFLALLLLVLQLAVVGADSPWQAVPEPLHWLHYALPMSWAVEGLRELMFGGSAPEVAGRDAAVLVGWLVVSLALTATAARRQRTWSVKRIKPELAL